MSRRSLQRPYIAFYQKHLGVINRTLKIDIVAPELLNKELIGAGDKEAFDRIIVNQGGIRAIERLFTEVRQFNNYYRNNKQTSSTLLHDINLFYWARTIKTHLYHVF